MWFLVDVVSNASSGKQVVGIVEEVWMSLPWWGLREFLR